jgi:type IV pilus assembly protein PilA
MCVRCTSARFRACFLPICDNRVTGNSKGFTLIELLIVVGIIGVIAAIATGTLMNARMAGNEASAIASVRAVISAQIAYNDVNRGYASSLSRLATQCGSLLPFLAEDLNVNGVTKSGYIFSVDPGAGSVAGPTDCNGVATETVFYATAKPVSVTTSGRRAFASNESTIWQDTTGVPPPEPFSTGGTISPVGR